MRNFKDRYLAIIAIAVLFVANGSGSAMSIANGMEAGWVLGQQDFTTGFDGSSPTFGAASPPNAATLSLPDSLAWDAANNRLFVLDGGNNRVLVYNGISPGTGFNGRAANIVLGQQSFSGSAPNTDCSGTSGIISACGLSNPIGMAYDVASGRLWVSDSNNSRVLGWNGSSIGTGAAADYVLGQGGFATNTVNRDCADAASSGPTTPNACGLDNPMGVSVGGGRIIVADNDNKRVVFFPESVIGQSSNKAAVGVLGEASLTAETRTVTQSDLGLVCDVLYDGARSRLYVAECDVSANRVMIWEGFSPSAFANGAAASKVLGQSGFTSGSAGSGSAGMSGPYRLAVHASGNRLFVSDASNNRVLVFDDAALANGEAAMNVLGQPDFSSVDPGTTRTTMYISSGLAFDASGDRLYAGDTGNHRILVYGAHFEESPLVVTGGTATTSGGTVNVTGSSGSYAITFPSGTDPLSGNAITIAVGSNANHPSIAINASLPAGQTKTVIMPWSGDHLCIDDHPGATIATQGSCNVPKVRVAKQGFDQVGECVVWEGSDTVCRTSATTLTVSGLEHSALYAVIDEDDDGTDDDADWCPATDMSGPIPTISLRPNHMGDGATINGCNAVQILACLAAAHPNASLQGEEKYGISPGQQNIFANRLSWAADTAPADGIPDCLQ